MTRSTIGLSLLLLLAGQGCVSASVQHGALIGAGSGAVVGAGLGYAISNEKLLGSPDDEATGNLSLDTTQAVLSSAAIGAVFGGIVGAMVGHQRERPNDVYLRRAAEQTEKAEQLGAAPDVTPRAF